MGFKTEYVAYVCTAISIAASMVVVSSTSEFSLAPGECVVAIAGPHHDAIGKARWAIPAYDALHLKDVMRGRFYFNHVSAWNDHDLKVRASYMLGSPAIFYKKHPLRDKQIVRLNSWDGSDATEEVNTELMAPEMEALFEKHGTAVLAACGPTGLYRDVVGSGSELAGYLSQYASKNGIVFLSVACTRGT